MLFEDTLGEKLIINNEERKNETNLASLKFVEDDDLNDDILTKKNDLTVRNGLNLITTSKITNWFSDNKRHSQGLFPELIRRLIIESLENISNVYFPAEDAIYTPGFDGELTVDKGNLFVPSGDSVWELGATTKYSKDKIIEDLNKRTKKSTEEFMNNKSIVLVTPIIYDDKTKFCKDYKGMWKEVKIIDAIDLELWLSQCLTTSLWLIHQYEEIDLNIMRLEDAWNQLANRTHPKLSINFFYEGRNQNINNLLDFINNKDKKVLNISSQSKLESYGFAVSTLFSTLKTSYNNVIIIKNVKDLEFLDKTYINYIFILDFELSNYYFSGNNKYIVLLENEVKISSITDLRLINRPPSLIHNILIKNMNLSYNKINKLKKIVRNNITLIIRELSSKNNLQMIDWNRKNLKELLPILLIGKINREDNNDLEILSKLLLNKNVNDYLIDISKWKDSDNSPITIYENIIKVNEKSALWILLKYELDVMFDSFRKLIYQIFSDNLKCNDYIFEGLLDSLILYSFINSQNDKVDQLASHILNVLTKKTHITQHTIYLRLAEASPKTILKEIENIINDNTIDSIIANGDINILIYSIELLLNIEEYNIQSFKVLFSLYKKYGAKTDKFKIALINNLCWLNIFNALTLSDKEKIILYILDKHNSPETLDLVINIITVSHLTYSVETKWRYNELIDHQGNNINFNDYTKKIVSEILKHKKCNIDHITKMYRYFKLYCHDLCEYILEKIVSLKCLNDSESILVYEFFINEKYNIINFNNSYNASFMNKIDNIIKNYEPTSLIQKDIVYFKNLNLNICPDNDLVNNDHDMTSEHIILKRQVIIDELLYDYPIKYIIDELIKYIPDVYIALKVFNKFLGDKDIYDYLFNKCIVYKKYNCLAYLIDLNHENAISICHTLTDNQFEDILPVFCHCDGSILNDDFLRNNKNVSFVFSNKRIKYNSTRYEYDNVKKYNPIEYISFISFNQDEKYWNYNDIIDALERLDIREAALYYINIERVIKKLDKFYYDERLVKVELKFIGIYYDNYVPNGLRKYLFANPNVLVNLFKNSFNDNIILYNKYYLPDLFYVNNDDLNNFISVLLNNSMNNPIIKNILGGILARTGNICDQSQNSYIIRDILEKIADNKVNFGYYLGIVNSGCSRIVDDGTKEYNKYQELKTLSRTIALEYPMSSEIINKLAEDYLVMSKEDKMYRIISD